MNFTTTKRCARDIVDIYLYGTQHFGASQAERYQAGLTATFAMLAASPRLARLRTEYRPPVRLHPYGSHMIAYVETQGGIRIVRVLHGRQNWQRQLG